MCCSSKYARTSSSGTRFRSPSRFAAPRFRAVIDQNLPHCVGGHHQQTPPVLDPVDCLALNEPQDRLVDPVSSGCWRFSAETKSVS